MTDNDVMPAIAHNHPLGVSYYTHCPACNPRLVERGDNAMPKNTVQGSNASGYYVIRAATGERVAGPFADYRDAFHRAR